jgi:hypothetical protein
MYTGEKAQAVDLDRARASFETNFFGTWHSSRRCSR